MQQQTVCFKSNEFRIQTRYQWKTEAVSEQLVQGDEVRIEEDEDEGSDGREDSRDINFNICTREKNTIVQFEDEESKILIQTARFIDQWRKMR